MSQQVVGSLYYLSPQSTVTRRYVAPQAELRLGQYESHEVPIRNGRVPERSLSLDGNGFVLAPHMSRVSNFRDPHEVALLYPPEIEQLVMHLTGAPRVVTFGFGHRSAAGYGTVLNPLRCQVTTQPATDVHVDYTPFRAGEVAYFLLQQTGIPPSAVRRLIVLNVWRAITDPPQNWPLTVCDASSVTAEEGVADPTIPVEVLPKKKEIPKILPPTPPPGGGMTFHFSAAHRWHYFPAMTRDEALVFVQHDSARHGVWRTPHASFADPRAAHAVPRESVEIRAIAYFF
jgi:hypothetical protein